MSRAPTCMKCGSHLFEVQQHLLQNAPMKLNFIQCVDCGGVIGVLDQYNIGAMLKMHGAAMKKLAAKARVQVDLPD